MNNLNEREELMQKTLNINFNDSKNHEIKNFTDHLSKLSHIAHKNSVLEGRQKYGISLEGEWRS